METKEKISDALRRLETLAKWFDAQKELDVEEGLKKVKEGALLIRDLKTKLEKVENEFREIKKDLEFDEGEENERE